MAEIQRLATMSAKSALAEVTYDASRTPKLQYELAGLNGHSGAGIVSPRPVLSTSAGEFAPPSDRHDLAGRGIILLPSRVCPPGDIIHSLEAFIHEYCDLPAVWEKLIARYCLMTWVFDKFTAVPYLRFLGEPASGKTRCVQVATSLSARAVLLNGSSSASSMFRLLDTWRGTLGVDEADFKYSDLFADLVKILNAGYTSANPVVKSEADGKSYDPRGFCVFGPKIISTRREFEDRALESRCLTLQMPDTPLAGRIRRQLPPDFQEHALGLRNRCLGWRFASWESLTSDEAALAGLAPRVGQIALPLWSVSLALGGPEEESWRADLLVLLGAHAVEQRASGFPAVVAEGLRRLSENASWSPRGAVFALRELVEQVTTIASDWALDELKPSPRHVASVLKSWNLPSWRARVGAVEFSVTRERLDAIVKRHVPPGA